MTREEMLNAAKTGGESNYVKLDIYFRLKTKAEVKTIEGGFTKKVPAYTWQEVKDDGGTKEYVDHFTDKPITGFLLGELMTGEIFDQTVGKKGGSYKSTPYFGKTDSLAVLNPVDGKWMPFANIGLADEWVAKQCGKTLKKRRIYYVATDKGILEINTNISLSIDQTSKLKGVDSAVFQNSLISFTPAMYDPKDSSLSKKTHEIQGAIGATNPSVYAKLEVVRKMEEADWATYKVDEALAKFVAYKNSKMVNTTPALEVPAAQPIPSSHIPKSEPFAQAPAAKNEDEALFEKHADKGGNLSDSLPF